MGVKMANRPGFFKFYKPSLGLENQKIPLRFIQSIKRPWPTNLALRDCYNNLWHVKVEKVGNDWYFEDGWTKFAVENMIEEGDLLVYEYFSQGLLDFKVYDGSACLIKGVEGQKPKSTGDQKRTTESHDTDDIDYDPIHEEEDWRDNYHKGERVMDGKVYYLFYFPWKFWLSINLNLLFESDDTDDIDYDPRTEEDTDDDLIVLTSEEDNQRFKFFEAVEVIDDDTDVDDCFPATEEVNQRDEYPTGKELVNGGQHVQKTREMDQERTERGGPRYNNPKVELLRDARASKRRMTRDHDWYGADIFRTGLIPQPKNPYFVTRRRERASELYIPMDLIKGYNLELPKYIRLLDPKGRTFRAKRKVWSDKRTFYVGGWKTLCGMNMVGDEDSCICEFVQKGGVFCISVSFFPPKES